MLQNNINHIIIIMLENRSFDNMMGYLSLPPFGTPNFDGLDVNRDIIKYDNENYSVHHLKKTAFLVDPNHSVEDVKEQMGYDENANSMRGFMKNFVKNRNRLAKKQPNLILGYYNNDQLKVFHHLFNEFYLCQKWFSCIPGPTSPNRAFAMSGKSKSGGKDRISNPFALKDLFDGPTIFQILDKKEISWRYYYHHFSQIFTFKDYIQDLFEGNENFLKFESLIKSISDSDGKDLNARSLTKVSWVDPNFGSISYKEKNDDHPEVDITNGQALISKILNAFYDSEKGRWKEIFKETLIFLFYDEHGGFYDHVAPPKVPVGLDYPEETYGLRVPGFIISPLIIKNYQKQKIYNHITAIRTILDVFVKEKNQESFGLGINVDKAEILDYEMFDKPRDLSQISAPPRVYPIENPKPKFDLLTFIISIGIRITEFLRLLSPKEDDIKKVINLVEKNTRPTFKDLKVLDDIIEEIYLAGEKDVTKIMVKIMMDHPSLTKRIKINIDLIESRIIRLSRQGNIV